MKLEYKHELTDKVASNFPTALVEDIEQAADDGRVIIDLEDSVIRVAARDDNAARWLADWLEFARGNYENDAAQQLRDAIEGPFLVDGEGTVNKDQE